MTGKSISKAEPFSAAEGERQVRSEALLKERRLLYKKTTYPSNSK